MIGNARFRAGLAALLLWLAGATEAPAQAQDPARGRPAETPLEIPAGEGLIDSLRQGAATATGAVDRDGETAEGEAPAETPSGAARDTPAAEAEAGPGAAGEASGTTDPGPATDAAAGTDPAGPEPETPPQTRSPSGSVGARLIDWFENFTQSAIASVGTDFHVARDRMQALRSIGRSEVETMLDLLPGLSILAGSALVLGIGARRLVRPLMAHLGRISVGLGPIRKLLIGILGALIDFFAMLAAGICAFLVSATIRPQPESEALLRTNFIAAYVVATVLVISLRAFFSPATPHMRAVPMKDATARAWTSHAIFIVLLLTFGEVLAAGVVGALTRDEIGDALVMLINLCVVLYLAFLVLHHRKFVQAHVDRKLTIEEDSIVLIGLAALAPYWTLPVLGYLGFLAHQSLTAGGEGIPVLITTLQISVALFIGLAVINYIDQIARRGVQFSDRTRSAFPTLEARVNAFVPLFTKLLRWTVIVIWTAFVLQSVGIFALWDWVEVRFGIDILGTVTSLMLIGFFGFLAWLLVTGWIDYRLTPRHGQSPTPREQTLLALLRNASLIAILLFVLITSLAEIGVSIAPLLASAGVVGLAIGFGSQKLVQDIITGVFIQFENAINVGDVIEAGGKTGVVEKLTIRSVSLRDIQGIFHVIPFSSVDLVSNHMMGYGYHLADIGVAYREDIDAAKDEMIAAYEDMQADPIWSTKLLGGIEWFGVQELADSAVILRARLKTRAGEQWAVGRAYSERVKKRFDAARIEIPFPHMTLWFGEQRDGGAPPAHVSFASTGVPPLAKAAEPPQGVSEQSVRPREMTDAGDEDD